MDQELNFFCNKKILITGHTGFKGSWLTTILKLFGGNILGYSNNNYQNNKTFYALELNTKVKSIDGCITDLNKLKKTIYKFKPEIVFHLAAQPLVSNSFKDPYSTFMTNSIGTLNILEILKNCNFIKSCVIITSDKCYKNKSQFWGYRESEELGGDDPYSASKASAEIFFNSYFKSFFLDRNIGISTVRAGNVIGGGDWSADRLIPDFIRSYKSKKPLKIRMPNSTRPWQHVLDPLFGYLLLAKKQFINHKKYSDNWNFGPDEFSISVKYLLNKFNNYFENNVQIQIDKKKTFKESQLLQLNCDKAKFFLGWKPKLNIQETLDYTANWYLSFLNQKVNMYDFTKRQIFNYLEK